MAIKNIFGRGIGFAPGSISKIVTRGFSIQAISITITAFDATWDGSGELPEAIYRNVTNSTNTVTIAGALVGGVQQTIDGENSISVSGAYFSIRLLSDGTNLMKFD